MNATAAPAPSSMTMADQYRLSRIQVHNWGTFCGTHDIPVPLKGLLLTGRSGSGKSSLLDALSTILVAPKDLRYNVAAQDSSVADRSRTLLSYVRGAYRRATDDSSGEVLTAHLRPRATRSAIALTFERAASGEVITFLALFHVGTGSARAADVATYYAITRDHANVDELLPYARNGIDKRALKRELEDRFAFYETYGTFAARLRQLLHIRDDVAQRLLHRTQAAKNLTSLDRLLRDFMLERPDTFRQAEQAVTVFEELKSAHNSVVESRQQRDLLLPLRKHARAMAEAEIQGRRASDLLNALDTFGKQIDLEHHRRALEEREQELHALEERREAAKRTQETAAAELEFAKDAYRGVAGDIAVLESEVKHLEEQLLRKERARQAFVECLERIGADVPGSRQEFMQLRAAAREEIENLERAQFASNEKYFAERERKKKAEQERHELTVKRDLVRKTGSSMPMRLLQARELIAREINVAPEALPFVGDLMTVAPESDGWRIAAEAVAGAFALTMVVSSDLYPRVATAVDGNNLRTLLTYEQVTSGAHPSLRADEHALSQHLRAREGTAFTDWLNAEILRRFTHTCVEDARGLVGVERGVTRAGQVKLSRTQHRKDDRNDLHDPTNWRIGVDVATKLAEIDERLAIIDDEIEAITATLLDVDTERRDLDSRRTAARDITNTSWEDIDTDDVRGHIDTRSRELVEARKAAPNADLAKRNLDNAQAAFTAANTALRDLHDSCVAARTRIDGHRSEVDRLSQLVSSYVQGSDEDTETAAEVATHRQGLLTELAERASTSRRRIPHEKRDEILQTLRQTLNMELEDARLTHQRTQTRMQSVMTQFHERWPANAAHMRADVEHLDEHLELLGHIEADDLPRHEARFAELLRSHAQQDIAQLANEIRGAARKIRTRITAVNEALTQVEYAPERFLRIEVMERRSATVNAFLGELNTIATGALGFTEETFDETESRFALLDRVMTKLGSSEPADLAWRNQCLDTRLHVTFRASERNSAGEEVNVHEGASGLSGGQRQKLVVFCLAAALRYQLIEPGESHPRYALVVLDEAFDKTDASFTRAGLSVFRDFGFQLLLATPLTKLQVMEDFIGGVTVVENSDEGDNSQLLHATYEDFDERALPDPSDQEPSGPSLFEGLFREDPGTPDGNTTGAEE